MHSLKYGRLPAKRPIGLRDLVQYLTDPLPAGPASVAAPDFNWGILGNDQYGDCTFAGAVHLREAVAAREGVSENWPTADQVVEAYKAYTGCVEPGDEHDSGANEADLLGVWLTDGLIDGNKILGYAPVDHRDHEELKSVVALFGGSYLGVAVPAPAQEQFGAGEPWDLTGTEEDYEIEGGHCVPGVGYDSDYLYVVTWGKVQPVTWRWIAAYMEEAWAVLLTEDKVNVDQLQKDLGLLHVG